MIINLKENNKQLKKNPIIGVYAIRKIEEEKIKEYQLLEVLDQENALNKKLKQKLIKINKLSKKLRVQQKSLKSSVGHEEKELAENIDRLKSFIEITKSRDKKFQELNKKLISLKKKYSK